MQERTFLINRVFLIEPRSGFGSQVMWRDRRTVPSRVARGVAAPGSRVPQLPRALLDARWPWQRLAGLQPRAAARGRGGKQVQVILRILGVKPLGEPRPGSAGKGESPRGLFSAQG